MALLVLLCDAVIGESLALSVLPAPQVQRLLAEACMLDG
jgi:hypothetical protein